ncbi:MAG: hypothetical protein DA396_07495, partial [Bacteroidetes bacterium]
IKKNVGDPVFCFWRNSRIYLTTVPCRNKIGWYPYGFLMLTKRYKKLWDLSEHVETKSFFFAKKN